MNSMRIVSAAFVVAQLVATSGFPQETSRDAKARKKETELQSASVTPTLVAPQCFESGSGRYFMKLCISERGNINLFESPLGQTNINGREGYVVCADHDDHAIAFDAGVAEAGWSGSSVTQPNGPGTFPLVVTRISSDGRIQLKQTITRNVADRGVDIKMDVKNTSGVVLTSVKLDRYFDGDIGGSAGDDEWRSTFQSVWGRNPWNPQVGTNMLLLTATNTENLPLIARAEYFAYWNPLGSGPQTARECGIVGFYELAGDGVGRVETILGDLGPGQTKSVTFRYRRF
jgi:hypothetical protein